MARKKKESGCERTKRLRKEFANYRSSKAWLKLQGELLKSQDGLCAYCGGYIEEAHVISVDNTYMVDWTWDFHVDHVIPLSKGGTNDPSNLVLACFGCNIAKGSKIDWQPPERMTEDEAFTEMVERHTYRRDCDCHYELQGKYKPAVIL